MLKNVLISSQAIRLPLFGPGPKQPTRSRRRDGRTGSLCSDNVQVTDDSVWHGQHGLAGWDESRSTLILRRLRQYYWVIMLLGCGRTGLEQGRGDDGAVGVGGVAGVGGNWAIGGTTNTVAASGGSTGCPLGVPAKGAPCTNGLFCPYVVTVKPCCQEMAYAKCGNGAWQIAETDCDCPQTGGAASTGGKPATGGTPAATGGSSGTGGSAGSSAVLGCRGDPLPAAPARCDFLFPATPQLVRVSNIDSASLSPLALARASDDKRCTSVVTTKPATASQPAQLVGLSFEPWSHWPASGELGPMVTIPLPATPSGTFVLGPSDDQRVALAWLTDSMQLKFGWDLDVNGFAGSYLDIGDALMPLAISVSGIGHTVGVTGKLENSTRTWSHNAGSYTNHPTTCADGTVVMGVEPYGNGFVWASSTGANNLAFGCPSYPKPAGPPSRINVGGISGVCCEYDIINFSVGASIRTLRTAPHPSGIWVVWQTDPPTQGLLHWARVTVNPPAVAASGTIEQSSDSSTQFATAALGSKLAVAWQNDMLKFVFFSVVDESGIVTLIGSSLPAGSGPLSLLSGPDGLGFLLGYSDGTLARLDCMEFE
jgi:hypothetical protein